MTMKDYLWLQLMLQVVVQVAIHLVMFLFWASSKFN